MVRDGMDLSRKNANAQPEMCQWYDEIMTRFRGPARACFSHVLLRTAGGRAGGPD